MAVGRLIKGRAVRRLQDLVLVKIKWFHIWHENENRQYCHDGKGQNTGMNIERPELQQVLHARGENIKIFESREKL